MLTLSAKGERTITGADIKLTGDIELINPEEHLATLTTKSADLSIEIKIERGLGYSPVESRKAKEKLSVGAIALDAFFSPVTKVNYVVDNMRVGDRTDYDRLKVEIETDGSIAPSAALHKAANILKDHFEKVSLVTVAQESEVEASPKKAKAKK
jgi:DNA-directed RNA polymerase subunit alpha